MTDTEIATIGKLADMCRVKGIRLIDIPGSIRLELEALPQKPEPKAPSVDADLCGCGHPEFAHTNGLCIHGCDVDKCVGETGVP